MRPAERSLATVLFTDIVGSTERAAELRDARWRELRAEHDRCVRRELRRFGGHEINTAGDSFLATFDRPAAAIACADAIRSRVRELGLEVRAGLHMGEIERVGTDVGGLGVHIGARVAAEAGPGEVLVSRSVHDALAGSAFDFEDRGVRALKGVPGEWRLFAVTDVPEDAGQALPGRWPGIVLRRRPLVAGAVVTALLLGVAAIYMSRRDTAVALTPEEVLAADAAPGIAVLPFTVSDPDLVEWREGMVDLLTVNLDGVPDLRAIDNRTVLARWDEAVSGTARPDLTTALAIARRTGARYALLGSVVAAGSDLRLTADVYEVRGGARLGQARVEGAPDSILNLVDRLTIEILRAVPRESGVLTDVDLAELTTDSLDALKAFLSGEALYRRADFVASADAYERAIASDSTFALAWARLHDTCGWSSGSELCGRDPPWEREEYLSRLPARKAEMMRANSLETLREIVREYPDDPYAWYLLGDAYEHRGASALVDRAEGDSALARAIALAPTTSAEPYIHLIEHAFADADSARVARLLGAFERITHGAGGSYADFRLAFSLGFGDPATRAETRASLDTVPTGTIRLAIEIMGNPRLHEASEEALRVLLARPDYSETFEIFYAFYRRGKLRAAIESADLQAYPAERALIVYSLYRVGVNDPPGELERILAEGAADTTSFTGPTFLWAGAYAVDRGQWDEYTLALDWERTRARRHLAQGDSSAARHHEGMARALEGYAHWKRGQKEEAIRALEAAHWEINGFERGRIAPWFSPNVTIRWWLGELMLEVGRPRDAERYFKSITADPFAALRLGRVYEELDEFEKARASYEYALLSWQDADPELQPRIQEARQGLARLPKPLRRERS